MIGNFAARMVRFKSDALLFGASWLFVSAALLLAVNRTVSPLAWLVSGFMAGMLVRLGPNRWPAIALGTLIAGLLFGTRTVGAFIGTVGTVLGAWCLASCLKRRGVHSDIRQRSDIYGFLLCVPFAAMIPATLLSLGVAVLADSSFIATDGQEWLRWWLSAMLGYLLGVPTLAGMTRQTSQQLWRNRRLALGLGVATVGLVAAMLTMPYGMLSIGPAPIAVVIVLVSALRFGLATTSLLIVILASAIAARYLNMQPPAPVELATARVWAFAAVLIVIALIVHVLLMERDTVAARLRDAESEYRLGLLRATQMEQQRIGRDVHDVLGQELTSLSLLAKGMAAQRSMDDAQVRAELLTLSSAADRALTAVRSIAHGLLPVISRPSDLPAALGDMARRVSESTGVLVHTEFAPIGPISVEVAENLLRIAQEAVNNAVKHAATSWIKLYLGTRDGALCLEIEDKGNGFDPDSLHNRAGVGLGTMRYRSELARGRLQIDRNAGGGTIVRCVLPNVPSPALPLDPQVPALQTSINRSQAV